MYYNELQSARDLLTGPGGDFEIVKTEILGNRIRVYKNAPGSIRDFWQSTAAFADRIYLVYQDERFTYAEAHRQTDTIAAWLFDQGLRPGDRVAIAMRNYPEWMLIYWACTSVGIAVVGMNAWWTATELAYGINDARPKVIFADADRLKRIIDNQEIQTMPSLVGVRSPELPDGILAWSEIITQTKAMPEVEIDPDSDACIFYTSGTTGFPKGAQLTHRGCIANLYNLMFASASSVLAMQMATGEAPPADPPVSHQAIQVIELRPKMASSGFLDYR